MTAQETIETDKHAAHLYNMQKSNYELLEHLRTDRKNDNRKFYTLREIKYVKRWPWSQYKEKLGPDLLPFMLSLNRYKAEVYLMELILFKGNYYFDITEKNWFDPYCGSLFD